MKKFRFLTILSAAVLLGLVSCQPVDEAIFTRSDRVASARPSATASYIIVLKNDALTDQFTRRDSFDKRQQLVRQYAEKMVSRFAIGSKMIGHVYGFCLKGFAAQLTDAQVALLRQLPAVDYIEPDRVGGIPSEEIMPDNSLFVQASTQDTPWGIKYVGGSVDYTGTNVAYIVDTGIDYNHVDLNVNTARGYNALTTGTGSTSLFDNHNHGTHMSGIIAARNNDFGVIGIAANAQVVPIKVTERPENLIESNLIAGLDFLMANAQSGDVINISLGQSGSDAVDTSILNLANRGDVYIAVSAGNVYNGNTDANNVSPARVNAPNLYTLSVHDNNGVFNTVSNSGNPPIDFAGPGVSIKSTVPYNKYAFFSMGASMPTAHAAGILLANGGVIYGKGTVTKDRDTIPDVKMSRVP